MLMVTPLNGFNGNPDRGPALRTLTFVASGGADGAVTMSGLIQAGDLIIYATGSASGDPPNPTGGTQVSSVINSAGFEEFHYRIADGTDAGSTWGTASVRPKYYAVFRGDVPITYCIPRDIDGEGGTVNKPVSQLHASGKAARSCRAVFSFMRGNAAVTGRLFTPATFSGETNYDTFGYLRWRLFQYGDTLEDVTCDMNDVGTNSMVSLMFDIGGGVDLLTSIGTPVVTSGSSATDAVLIPDCDAGDLIILASFIEGTGIDAVPTVPSGFSQIEARTDGSLFGAVMHYKVADGTESQTSINAGWVPTTVTRHEYVWHVIKGGNKPIQSVVQKTSTGLYTTGVPTATLTIGGTNTLASTGPCLLRGPSVLIAAYMAPSGVALSSVTFKDGNAVVISSVTTTDNSDHMTKIKTFNESAADIPSRAIPACADPGAAGAVLVGYLELL